MVGGTVNAEPEDLFYPQLKQALYLVHSALRTRFAFLLLGILLQSGRVVRARHLSV